MCGSKTGQPWNLFQNSAFFSKWSHLDETTVIRPGRLLICLFGGMIGVLAGSEIVEKKSPAVGCWGFNNVSVTTPQALILAHFKSEQEDAASLQAHRTANLKISHLSM